MTTFSLVHGSWHGGWCWDRLREQLEARGHVVQTPDLPCEDVDAGIAEYASCIPPCDVVVGHSLGGLTIPLVDARVRVYLCALVPGVPAEYVAGFGDSRIRDDLGRSYYPDWRDAARDLQYPERDAQLAQRLRRQAPVSSDRPVPEGGVYVVCTRDAAVSPAWQREVSQRFTHVTLDAGHSPMLTHAEELAEILLRVEL